MFWLAFWLLFPMVLFGILGFLVALIASSLAWGVATFILLFCVHGLAIWRRLKNATDAIVGDPVQASWVSSTLATVALLAVCFIGLAVVSFASFSAGMSVSLLDLSGGNEQQQPHTPERKDMRTCDDQEDTVTLPPVLKEPPTPQTIGASEVHTKNNLPVWWRRGDSSMPVVGFDATPIADNPPWDNTELCRPGLLVVFSRSSNDGPLTLNIELSRERAETLLSILTNFVEGCTIDQQPDLLAVSLGQSKDPWHDGSQRVVKLGLVPRQTDFAEDKTFDREMLSVIGDSIQLSVSRYDAVEVCSLHQNSPCEWQKVLDSP